MFYVTWVYYITIKTGDTLVIICNLIKHLGSRIELPNFWEVLGSPSPKVHHLIILGHNLFSWQIYLRFHTDSLTYCLDIHLTSCFIQDNYKESYKFLCPITCVLHVFLLHVSTLLLINVFTWLFILLDRSYYA